MVLVAARAGNDKDPLTLRQERSMRLTAYLTPGAEPWQATPMRTDHVDHSIFELAIADARAASRTIRDATSPSEEYPRFGADYYLTPDRLSGYGVDCVGELIGLFSLVRGRGAALVAQAIEDGASSLDCFDGFLPEFYAQHGFVEFQRAPNWDPEGPDVVSMFLPFKP